MTNDNRTPESVEACKIQRLTAEETQHVAGGGSPLENIIAPQVSSVVVIK